MIDRVGRNDYKLMVGNNSTMMKIKFIDKVIHKMRTLVELQKFKMKTGTKRRAPLPPNEVDLKLDVVISFAKTRFSMFR